MVFYGLFHRFDGILMKNQVVYEILAGIRLIWETEIVWLDFWHCIYLIGSNELAFALPTQSIMNA